MRLNAINNVFIYIRYGRISNLSIDLYKKSIKKSYKIE